MTVTKKGNDMGSRKLATLGIAIAVLMLPGCSAQPSQDEIEERFAIEIASTLPGADKDDATVRELAAQLGENAAEDCNNADLWRVATSPVSDSQWEPSLQYIQAAACSVLYGDAIDEDLAEEYRRVITEHVLAEIEPDPAPSASAEPEPTPTASTPVAVDHVISGEARQVLDTNLGTAFETSAQIKDQYCTMSDSFLASTAEVWVDMWRGVTEADIIAYVNEVCGR